MRVYRFERNGYGPYTYKSPAPVVDQRLNSQIDKHEWDSSGRWPTAMSDGIPYHHAIGCLSLADLEQWFDGMMGSLVRCGFRIRIYEVRAKDLIIGDSGRQVGFKHKKIKEIIR